jgi:histidinol-phosphate aminotransferase
MEMAARRQIVGAAASPGAQNSLRSENLILLDRNENPYGPFPAVLEEIRASLDSINRHPRTYAPLVEEIAALHGARREQVLLGCGSTDILRMAASAFLGSGTQLVQASPTFEALSEYARAAGAEVISVPLRRDLSHDLDAMLARSRKSTTLVYICNPNNPTGTITPRQEMEAFIGRLAPETFVVMDEAYHHYAAKSGMYASFIDRPLDRENVIVTRTFSTVYGLAGLRLGYAIASPRTVKRMSAFLAQENVNTLAAQAGVAALKDNDGLAEAVARNTNQRQEFFNQAMLRAMKPVESHANFVLMNTFHPADEMIAFFRRNQIALGPQSAAFDTHIRVSLGRPEDMNAFWSVWDRLPYPKGTMHH